MKLKKWCKRLGWFSLLLFAALQFANPSHQNPPVVPGQDALATNAPPSSVAALLKNSCYDCHSLETKWPWYSYIAPVSWYVKHDIDEARASMNFSEWPHDDPKRARKRWRHIAGDVQDGEMPPASYTWMHPHARMNAQQRAELVKWAEAEADQ
jgi:hypothetical protein